jgi:hypothetical protein
MQKQPVCSPLIAVLLLCVHTAHPFSFSVNPPRREGFRGSSMATEPGCTKKLLFIHGKGENGAQFRHRLAPLEGAIAAEFAAKGDEIKCEFLTAPHLIKSDDKFAWWNLKPGERSFEEST